MNIVGNICLLLALYFLGLQLIEGLGTNPGVDGAALVLLGGAIYIAVIWAVIRRRRLRKNNRPAAPPHDGQDGSSQGTIQRSS